MRKTKKKVIFSCLFLMLSIVLVLLKFCFYNVKSYDELSKILGINLTNGINIQNVVVEDYITETRIVIFYQADDSVFQNNSQYSFKTDYDPLPSLDKNEDFEYLISKYLMPKYFTEFDLKYEDLDYINTEFSTISNKDFEIKLFIFSKAKMNAEHSVVLIADIPIRLKLKQ